MDNGEPRIVPGGCSSVYEGRRVEMDCVDCAGFDVCEYKSVADFLLIQQERNRKPKIEAQSS